MEIIPIRQEYKFSILKHNMYAVAEHVDGERHLSYYFDEKLVSKKVIPGGEFYTDDECLRDAVDDYRKNNVGIYADIFNSHTDKVFLQTKTVVVDLENFGIIIRAKIIINKDIYEIELSTNDGDNLINAKIKANGFSEVLEKVRLFTNTLYSANEQLSQNISLLSNDKVEELIKWIE